jgi:transcriptional regulator with XRE-family HTH domain
MTPRGLLARLIADTDSGEALPLLAFILRQLADGLPVGGTLSLSRYHDLGGVRGSLTRHADTALAEAVQATGLSEDEVLAGLTRLVTVDQTGRRGRRRIKVTGLPESLRVALHVFLDRRLLLSDTDDDGQLWLTIAHEALLTGWRPLDTTTTDITTALRAVRTVELAATEWNSAGRPEYDLWDAKQLTTTLATLGMAGDGDSRNPPRPPVELDEDARAFLNAATRRLHSTKEHERSPRRTLAEKINRLFETLHPPDRGPWSNQEVERWLADRATVDRDSLTISANYLLLLRNGQRNNPTIRNIQAMAKFFQIDPGYFLRDDTEQTHTDLQLIGAIRDNKLVKSIALRAFDLDPQMREWLAHTINSLPRGRTKRGRNPDAGQRSKTGHPPAGADPE